MEFNKDKVFTKRNMIDAYQQVENVRYSKKGEAVLEAEFIQSLQQPTEIEVEIEMESTLVGQCNCPCHTNKGIKHIKACCNPKRIEQPKINSEGCLILKKL